MIGPWSANVDLAWWNRNGVSVETTWHCKSTVSGSQMCSKLLRKLMVSLLNFQNVLHFVFGTFNFFTLNNFCWHQQCLCKQCKHYVVPHTQGHVYGTRDRPGASRDLM